jgi:hypothetical protein
LKSKIQRVLILCKTYPSPSAKYIETSCVAGIDESGNLVRIYPMPFRLVSDDQQFKKWQWIEARIEKAPADHRPESHKIYVDTIKCDESPLPTGESGWKVRRQWLNKIQCFTDFNVVEENRMSGGGTLALLKPSRIIALDIKPSGSSEWSEDEKQKLLQLQSQGELFNADEEGKRLRLLKKIPFDFHYRYECDVDGKTFSYRHKLVDWEIGMLYWNVRGKHGENWQAPFRQKLEAELPAKELMFLMGTIHRFPDQWLIVSVIYPPKQPPEAENQLTLFAR